MSGGRAERAGGAIGDRVVVKGSFRPCEGFRRGPTRLAKAEAAFYFDKQSRREYYIFY